MEELYTPYLLSEGENLVYTVCIHVERGCFPITNVYVWYNPWEFQNKLFTVYNM